jgi:hypothetical protein
MSDHEAECFYCKHAKDTPPNSSYEKECSLHGYLLTDVMSCFDGSCEDWEEQSEIVCDHCKNNVKGQMCKTTLIISPETYSVIGCRNYSPS